MKIKNIINRDPLVCKVAIVRKKTKETSTVKPR